MKIRLINTGFNSAYYNMGLDQALSEQVAKTKVPVLRFYGWNPKAISIGYFQKIEEEVNLEKCAEFGVDTVRRITGGGAVFHDSEITYSFILPEDSELIRKPILDSYQDLSAGIVEAGKILGLDIKFVPLNDLVIGAQKISGNAQTRRNGVILQHGTVLLNVDVEKMFDLLLVPNEKLKGKMIETVKERVTSLSTQLGREIAYDEAYEVLVKGYALAFKHAKFELGEVTPDEEAAAIVYANEKYSLDSWRFKF